VNLRHISLLVKSKQLFHIRFCTRFSAMRFYEFLSTLKSLGGVTVMLIA